MTVFCMLPSLTNWIGFNKIVSNELELNLERKYPYVPEMFATSLTAMIKVCFRTDSSSVVIKSFSIHMLICSLIESIFLAFWDVKYFLLGEPLLGVPSGENSLKK